MTAQDRTAYKREWRRRNPESVKASIRKYRENHRDKVREIAREWAARNPEKKRAATQANRDKNRHYENYRVRYTPEEEKRILDHTIHDSELARLLGRTLKAIQAKRETLLKRRYFPNDPTLAD